MQFKDIKSLKDLYSFFKEREIEPTPENQFLLKIDKTHFLRLIEVPNLNRNIANELKKKYAGSELYTEYLLIIKKDFKLFIFKKLYGEPDTIIYDKTKNYPKDTEQSLLKKINSLEFEDSESNSIFFEFFDVREVVEKFYEEYRRLRSELSSLIKGTPNPELLAQLILDRIIFIYFLQVKEIIPNNFLATLYYSMKKEENFFKNYLEPIFFELFNKEINSRNPIINEKFPNIPYLNGGLFSRFENLETINGTPLNIQISNEIWKKIFSLFNSYNWIIEEKQGDTISITPSVLGHIYEKSVVQKETGSYYTPKEITNYIAKNTISSYENILDLLNQKDFSDTQLKQISTLYFEFLKKLSICDPACGSGAFLIAAEQILYKLYKKCVIILENTKYFEKEKEKIQQFNSLDYYIKREIITNNLYGVDIQEGCVEIAKLRLWLSLISEMPEKQKNIEPLPNIDFNIMVGNSLIGYEKLPKKIKTTILDWIEEKKSIVNELKELKNEYRKTKSSQQAQKIKNVISLKSKTLNQELNEIFCNNNQIILYLRVETKNKEKNKILNEIKEINEKYEIKKFKIKLNTNKIIKIKETKSINGIKYNKSGNKISSISSTKNFNFNRYKKNTKISLSSLINSLINDWRDVEYIEFSRLLDIIIGS